LLWAGSLAAGEVQDANRRGAGGRRAPGQRQGRAVQVDSIKTRVDSAYGFTA
jgi:hypothetical protein